jgi:AcrR family transcriptional regulator
MSQKDRIIEAATTMFVEQGIRSVRMDDIATELGVSKRTLYEMFSDKSALLQKCVTHHFTNKRNSIEELTSVTDNVMKEIFTMLDNMKRDEKEVAFVENLRKFYPDIYDKQAEIAQRYSYEKLKEMFNRGIEQGLFLSDMNKELALVTLVYTMSALFEKKHYFPVLDQTPPEEAFRYILVNYFRGLSTPKGIELIDNMVKQYKKAKKIKND